MKTNADVSKLLLDIVESQRQKIAAAYKLGWLSQEFYRQAIVSLDKYKCGVGYTPLSHEV